MMATIAMRRCNYLILLLAVPILLFGSATSSPYNSNSRTSPPSTKVLSISSSNADVAAVPSHHRRHLSKVLSLNRGGGAEGARSLTSTVDAIWKAHPLVAGATVCAVKASLADLVAQNIQFRATRTAAKKFRRRMVESQKFDFRRTFAFMLFGGLYQGVVQALMINNFYTYLFGSATTALVVTKKVLFNAIFQDAMICMPTAYTVKALVFGYSIHTALQNYWDDVRYHGLLLKNFMLWIPVNFMVFTFVPPHFRTTVMAFVSFVWMIILSTISSRSR